MVYAFWTIGFLTACTVATMWLICRAQPLEYEEPAEIERLQRIIASAKHHREQLEARADEIVTLHRYHRESCEADDLRAVIFDGEEYEAAIQRIMRRKVSKA